MKMVRFIADWFNERGVQVTLDVFNPTHLLLDGQARPDTANIYVKLGHGEQTLLLYAHTDVVNAQSHLYQPRIEKDRLIGRVEIPHFFAINIDLFVVSGFPNQT